MKCSSGWLRIAPLVAVLIASHSYLVSARGHGDTNDLDALLDQAYSAIQAHKQNTPGIIDR